MSYILDALKKSESERRAAAAPGLAGGASYIVAPQSRPRHRGTAVILGIGMLATGLALGNWRAWQGEPVAAAPAASQLATQMPELPVAQSGEQAAGAERKTAGADRKKLAADRKVLPGERKSAATERNAVTGENGAVLAAAKQPAAQSLAAPTRTPPAVAAAGRPTGAAPEHASAAPVAAAAAAPLASPAAAAQAAFARTPAPHAQANVAVAAPAARGAALPAAAPAAAAPLAAAAAPPAAQAAPPADRVLAYRELPAAVQGALPPIVFGGFAGGAEGEAKMAFINSRLLREGEDLSPGLRLEAVNQDGAVFAYQGYRFRAAN